MKGVTVYYRAADPYHPNSEPKRALLGGQGTLDFSELVDEAVIQLVPESPLSQVHNLFHQLGIRLCLLTRKGRLEGLLTKRAFLSATSAAVDCAARRPS
ncbi:MAG: uncharacterized protein KVP18_003605 [Porospora cf. gigantea A]|uniref:uncharacterized protein n=1 Tax=Porospora cf. gigantea A TaxID=2853593 RepID=UPI0035596708|nr:MAG: hypothetical protein KVP18_003605 [Porospora cf. gigantea A]